MPKTMRGTRDDLIDLRHRLTDLRSAYGLLDKHPGTASMRTTLQRKIDDLAAHSFLLEVPCTSCRTAYPVELTVGDNTLPSVVICGECDAKALRTSAAH